MPGQAFTRGTPECVDVAPAPLSGGVISERQVCRHPFKRARAHTHTPAKTHRCAQPDANMTACQHLRPSFYQPGLNIDPIDCPKALLPFAAENASPQAALMETEAQSHPQARPCYTQVTGLYHRCGDCDARIVRTCVLALKSLVVWWTTCTGEETGVCV